MVSKIKNFKILFAENKEKSFDFIAGQNFILLDISRKIMSVWITDEMEEKDVCEKIIIKIPANQIDEETKTLIDKRNILGVYLCDYSGKESYYQACWHEDSGVKNKFQKNYVGSDGSYRIIIGE